MRSFFFGEQIWQMASIIWHISAHRFDLNCIGEIEWQFFLPNAVHRHFFALRT